MYGREIRLPFDFEVGYIQEPDVSVADYVIKLSRDIRRTWEIMADHSETQKLHQKATYDSRLRGPQAVNIGDLVMLNECSPRGQNRNPCTRGRSVSQGGPSRPPAHCHVAATLQSGGECHNWPPGRHTPLPQHHRAGEAPGTRSRTLGDQGNPRALLREGPYANKGGRQKFFSSYFGLLTFYLSILDTPMWAEFCGRIPNITLLKKCMQKLSKNQISI